MPEARKTDTEVYAMQVRAAAASAAAVLLAGRGTNRGDRPHADHGSDIVRLAEELVPYIATGQTSVT